MQGKRNYELLIQKERTLSCYYRPANNVNRSIVRVYHTLYLEFSDENR